MLDCIYEAIKGADSQKKIKLSEISSYGYVSAKGTHFSYDQKQLLELYKVFQITNNYEVTPCTDGTVEVSVGIKDATIQL